MKKLLYILMISIVTMASVTSCTEEEVKPTAETANNGGGAIDPGK